MNLAYTFAEHVLIIFEQYFPEDKSARRYLDMMLHHMNGQQAKDALELIAEDLDRSLLAIIDKSDLDHPASQAGLSILGLAGLLADDEYFEACLIDIADNAQKAVSLYDQDMQHASKKPVVRPNQKLDGGHKAEVEWQFERIIELLKE